MKQNNRMKVNGNAGGKYLRSGRTSRKKQAVKRRGRRRLEKTVQITVIALILLFTTMAIVNGFRGCEKQDEPVIEHETTIATTEEVTASPETTVSKQEPPTPVQTAPIENPTDANVLLSDSNHMSVVDTPSKNGCTVLPALRSQEGETGSMATYNPELTGEDVERVIVQYKENCTFQIANVSVWTKIVTYEEVTVDDLKRGDLIIIYGEYDSDNVLHADRVIIYNMLV